GNTQERDARRTADAAGRRQGEEQFKHMPKVAVVTDSNSGITVEEGKRLGVEVVPMPVLIDGKTYYEGVDLTQEEFYRKQLTGADLATSQPAPGDVIAVWDRVLEDHDQLVYIPMSAGLSASC